MFNLNSITMLTTSAVVAVTIVAVAIGSIVYIIEKTRRVGRSW